MHTLEAHLRATRASLGALAILFALGAGAALLFLGGCNDTTATPAVQPVVTPVATTSAVQLEDATQKAGIRFTHNNGAFGLMLMPEIMGSGVAWIDYDGDGFQDLFLVNSRDWSDAEITAYRNGSGKDYPDLFRNKPNRKRSTCALYHNNGDGTFTDVTSESGLDFETYGMGGSVGDYDNDGKPDLYLTALDRNYLFHNEGGGKFKEVSDQLGVRDTGWSTSAAWVDYNKDGRLDLFVCHYVKWSPSQDAFCNSARHNKDYCTPESYRGEVCRLYRNDGAKFTDVTNSAGISISRSSARKLEGKALGVATTDFNNDGWPDIVVANDTEPNYLFENLHGNGFREVGQEVGIALNEAGQTRAAMGVDCADFNRSGRESLIFGNFSNQMLSLYENQGNRLFIDVGVKRGVGQPSLDFLAFGTIFTDFDNDGWPDIFVANGHVQRDIGQTQRDVTFKERPLLFVNKGNGEFSEVGLKTGAALSRQVVGRGVAAADYDLDGKVDVVLTANGDEAILFRNLTSTGNGAIRLTLEGTKSNRSAIGAVVEVTSGGASQRYSVRSGSSYCSQSELPITAGLGTATKADLKIQWPSGKVTDLKDIAAGQMLVVNEDKGIEKQAPFGKK